MLDQEWKGVYRILDDRQGNNRYINRIRTNIARVNLMACSLASGSREVVAQRFLVD
jgi:hypothetical protein